MMSFVVFINVDVDNCASSPCQNGGICNNLLNNYTCTCNGTWTGYHCSEATLSCNDITCYNNATCSTPYGSAICSCASGYTDAYCQVQVCDPKCVHGYCMDFGSSCSCLDGWSGTYCTIPICTTTCGTYGTCTAPDQCTCIDGYVGALCNTVGVCGTNVEWQYSSSLIAASGIGSWQQTSNWLPTRVPGNTDNAYIASDTTNSITTTPTISHNGIVASMIWLTSSAHVTIAASVDLTPLTVSISRCECDTGYTGINCDIVIDNCGINPCENNATCINSVGSSSCQCTNGWTGTNCTIEDCTPTCGTYGTCIGTDICSCDIGWIDNLTMPCVTPVCDFSCNNGTCTAPNICTCYEGYTSYNCTVASMCRLELDYVGYGDDRTDMVLPDNFAGTSHSPGYRVPLSTDVVKVIPTTLLEVDIDDDTNYAGLWLGQRVTMNLEPGAILDIGGCSCAPGYGGPFCGDTNSKCQDAPCLNGGTCSDRAGDYYCTCQPGYITKVF
jgi:hypothetical protein